MKKERKKGRKVPINGLLDPGPGKGPGKRPSKKVILIFLTIIGVAVIAMAAAYFTLKQDIRRVDVGEFLRAARSGAIERILVNPEDGKTRRYVGYYGKSFITESDGIETLLKNGSYAAAAIEKISIERGITLDYQEEPPGHWSGWWLIGGGITLVISLAIVAYAFAIYLFPFVLGIVVRLLMDIGILGENGAGGRGENLGGGKGGSPKLPPAGKQADMKKQKVTFKDVAGCKEAKEELMEVVDYLKGDRELYEILGGKLSKGVLLHGLPGTGKTLLARALAGEAGVPFIHAGGSEFIEMFVGVGASRIRGLMEKARKQAPCIVFIDEIDTIGRRRAGSGSGGDSEHQQTITQLLHEMDGFKPSDGVIFLAATNRLDMMDPAILRGGRFGKKINVDLPEIADRVDILKIHVRNTPLSGDVNLNDIAKLCSGFSGADLEDLVNEAVKLTIREIKSHPKYKSEIRFHLWKMLLAKYGKMDFPVPSVPHANFVKAWDTIIAGGGERPNIMGEKEKRDTAIHEAGHALIAYIRYVLEPDDSDPLYKVSIIPRGRALGLTYQLPEEDVHSTSKRRAYNKLIMLFGGWAAEKIVIGVTTSGVRNDLERATELVKRMVLEWGMSTNLPPMNLAGSGMGAYGYGESRADKYSGATEVEINSEIRALITVGHQKAELMVNKNRSALDALTEALLEKETLDQEECEKILKENIPPENLKPDAYSTRKEEHPL